MAAATILAVPAIALTGAPTAPQRWPSRSTYHGLYPGLGRPASRRCLRRSRSSLDDFKFTPAAAKGRPSDIRVAIRARSWHRRRIVRSSRGCTGGPALTPAAFSLGAAVGWRRFALSGDLTKVDEPRFGDRRSQERDRRGQLNLSKFTGRVALGADRGNGRIAALTQPDNVSVDVGAAYNLNRRVALTGGVRYRVDQNRAATITDQRRDSQAVYVGTAFKF